MKKKIVLELEIEGHDEHYVACDMGNMAYKYQQNYEGWIMKYGKDDAVSKKFNHMKELYMEIAKQFNKQSLTHPIKGDG